jgi:histidine triad (HIT) family protein
MTIFEKIVAREIPAKIVWEDDEALAFEDINPQAPVHVLIVPKKVIPRLGEATEKDRAILGKLLLIAGERVPHLHIHLLGKRALAWPPG